MPGTPGRPYYLDAWASYDWAQTMRYSVGSFPALTFTGTDPRARTTTVAMAGQYAAGSQVGLLYGLQANQYNRKTRLVPGPSASVALLELSPATVYHVAAYGVGSDGCTYIGADTLLTMP